MSALADLVIKLSADTASLQRDMGRAAQISERAFKQMNSAARTFKAAIATIGVGVGLGALIGQIKGLADAADNIGEKSVAIGLSAGEYQKLQLAVERSGVSQEAFSTGLKKFAQDVAAANAGAAESVDHFRRLGVSITDSAGNLKSMSTLVSEVGARFANVPDGIEKTALATELFGRAGTEWIPAFNSDLAGVQARVVELGGVMSDRMVAAGDEFNNTMADTGILIRGLKAQIGEALLPVLSAMAQEFIGNATAAGGLKDSLKDVAGLKGIFIDFFEALVQGAAFVGDAFASLRDTVKVVSSFAVQGLSDLTSSLRTAHNLLQGDLKEAQQVNKDAAAFRQAAQEDRGNILNREQFRDRAATFFKGVRERVATADQAATPTPKQAKPPTVALPAARSKSTKGGSTFDALKAALDRDTEALQASIKREEELLKDRNEALGRYQDAGLISQQDFFGTKLTNQEDYLANVDALFKREIEALQNYIKKAKKPEDRNRAEKELTKVLEEQAKAHQEVARAGIEDAFARTKALDELKRKAEDVRAQLLDAQGKTGEAAALRFDLQNADQLRDFLKNGQQDAADMLKRLRELTVAQAEFSAVSERAGAIQERLGITERRIQLDVETGIKSELSAMQALGVARQAAVAQLDEQVAAAKRIAEASKNDADIRHFEQLKLSLDELKASADVVGNKMNEIFTSGATDFLTDFITHTKTAKEAFADFGKSIFQQLTKLATQDIASKIFGAVGGGASGGGGSGGGIGQIVSSIFGSLFGGGGRAIGGPVMAGVGYTVGETGRERFIPTVNGVIQPMTRESGSSASNHVNITVNVPRETSRNSADQTAASVGLAVRRALARNH